MVERERERERAFEKLFEGFKFEVLSLKAFKFEV